jgi:dihydromonapterin reductase/dihydrofolate reductase
MARLANAILITGAAQRIGLDLAQRFLAQGEAVLFTYRTRKPGVEQLLNAGAIGYQVDFTDAEAVTVFTRWLASQVTSLRAVIHNASLWKKESSLTGVADLEALWAVHVRAPYQINQACLPLLRQCSQRADVIAISDAKASRGHPDYTAYLASKAGLESMIRSLARDWAPQIKCNTLAPGLVIFNQGDSESLKQTRLAENAIPEPIGLAQIWQSVSYLMQSPAVTGTRLEVGQLQRECFSSQSD